MKVIRSINIEESVWKKLQELAKKENRSASNFIEYLIEKWEKGESDEIRSRNVCKNKK